MSLAQNTTVSSRRNVRLIRCLVFALGLVSGAGLAQQTVRLELSAEPLGEVSPWALTGFNYGNFMRVVGYEQDFARLSLRSLRFPPGNQADEIPLDAAALDAFRVQWQLLGEPEVVAVANLFQGTPGDAADAARYFIQVGMPVRVWEIGNEPDLYATNRMDPSWTPEKYCERFRAFATALGEVDPGYLLAGPAVSGARPSGEAYLGEVLRRCGDVIDVLTWHVYPTDGTWTDEAALATSKQVGQEMARYRNWLGDPNMNPLGHNRDIQLGITEYGLSWRTSSFRHLEDMTAALWLADALGQMASGGLELGHYFALQGTGGHGLIDSSGWLRPTYYVFEMLSDFSGQVLDVDSDDPFLRAYAVRQEAGVRVLLVNTAQEIVDIRLEGLPPGEITVATLSEPIFDEHLSYRLDVHHVGGTITVPARAVVVVTQRGGP